MESLTNVQLRKLKAMAQTLEPMLTVGKSGLSDAFIRTVDEALTLHELVKVRFGGFKEQKKELGALLAEKTLSHPVMRVGHVLVLFRQQPEPSKRSVQV